MSSSLAQRLGWVLWPSFLMACVAELAFFALFDPMDLHLFGVPVEVGRMPVYTVGFFAFWMIGAVSSSPFTARYTPIRIPGRNRRARLSCLQAASAACRRSLAVRARRRRRIARRVSSRDGWVTMICPGELTTRTLHVR